MSHLHIRDGSAVHKKQSLIQYFVGKLIGGRVAVSESDIDAAMLSAEGLADRVIKRQNEIADEYFAERKRVKAEKAALAAAAGASGDTVALSASESGAVGAKLVVDPREWRHTTYEVEHDVSGMYPERLKD